MIAALFSTVFIRASPCVFVSYIEDHRRYS
jgi:hypothetical protein